jgi:hypothetical protein
VMDKDLEEVLIMQATKAAFRNSVRPSKVVAEEYKKAKQAWLDSLKAG